MAGGPLRLGDLGSLLFCPTVEIWGAFLLAVSLICELVYVKDWGKRIPLDFKLLQERQTLNFKNISESLPLTKPPLTAACARAGGCVCWTSVLAWVGE